MPELPEVETTRRGIAPHLTGRRITRLVVREPRLRWPVPATLPDRLAGRHIEQVSRRAKYLLLTVPPGTLILHLGMSGSLRLVPANQPPARHDHLDLVLAQGLCLRLTDPRRFGSVHWTEAPPADHPLLRALGPEPLTDEFDGDWLYARSRNRRSAVKPFVMNAQNVVGVGNIYASEALHLAGIDPARAAGRIGRDRYRQLATAIKTVLRAAIEAGGTTLRDFLASDGRPGYFRHHLRVYGRAGEPCPQCATPIRLRVLGQRATYDCVRCQH